MIDLDRPIARGWKSEELLLAAAFAAAVLLRLLWLGDRPLHHDESIHAYYSWRILEFGPQDYRYDPVYHGPVLYYGTAIFQWIFGPSDWSSRLFPLLSSLGLVALAWPLRALIGRGPSLIYAWLVVLSPALSYYGRSLRHDAPMAFLTTAAVVFFLRYLDNHRRRELYGAAVAIGLASATKEDIYLTAFLFFHALWILPIVGWREFPRRRWFPELGNWLQVHGTRLATAILVALTLYLVLYTSLLTRPENWNATGKALTYWWGQHTIARIGGPWWYYLPLVTAYELPIFLGALGALASALHRRPERGVHTFLLYWAVSSFAIYSWAQEKVPWLMVPFLVPQAIVAAQFYCRHRRIGALVAAPALLLSLWGLVASNYLHDAPRADQALSEQRHEPMVYVQTTYDMKRVLDRIARVRAATGQERLKMVVYGEATWPLSWYLRDHDVHWGRMPREVDQPILVLDVAEARRVADVLDPIYSKMQFAVRGWWQIDWEKVSLGGMLDFLLHRRGWNLPGTTDAVLLIARDLQKPLEPISVDPPPEALDYQEPPTAPEIVATRAGLDEPRGLAFDSAGKLYVANTKAHRIHVYDPEGRRIAVWGEQGDGPGQFREPGDLDVGPSGEIFVADTWNHRVQKLAADGQALASWSVESPGFWGPRAIAVAGDGTVFVADTGNKRIVRFDRDGRPLRIFGTEGSENGQFVEPVGLAIIGDDAELAVADTGNRRVQFFNLDGGFLRSWRVRGWEQFYSEPYLAWDGFALWASDSFGHRVNRYDRAGELLESIGGAGHFNRPVGVAVDPAGEVWVSDTMNDRVLRLGSAPPTRRRLKSRSIRSATTSADEALPKPSR